MQVTIVYCVYIMVFFLFVAMKRMSVLASNNQEFHARIFLLSLKSGVIIMDMTCVKLHLQIASRSMQTLYIVNFM